VGLPGHVALTSSSGLAFATVTVSVSAYLVEYGVVATLMQIGDGDATTLRMVGVPVGGAVVGEGVGDGLALGLADGLAVGLADALGEGVVNGSLETGLRNPSETVRNDAPAAVQLTVTTMCFTPPPEVMG
jgi:hypothetical protein